MQNNITLFFFSKIVPEFSLRISEYNSFNYNFPEFELRKAERSQITSNPKYDMYYYMKKVYVNLPSNNRLKEEKFKKDFFADYNNSFANFCDINEKTFTELYLKESYIPKINIMGDIKVNIDNIIKSLNEFSETKRLKKKRRIRNPYKLRKRNKNRNGNFYSSKRKILFKIDENKTNKNNNNEISLEEKYLDEKNKDENESLYFNNNDNNKDSENKPYNKSLLNIKKKLNNIITLKKNTTFMNNEIKSQIKEILDNNLEKELNNPNDISYNFFDDISNLNNIENLNKDINLGIFPMNNDYQYKISQTQDFKFDAFSNKNNIFNFSSNEIMNLGNNFPKNNNNNNDPFLAPFTNNEDNNNNVLLSPYKSLLTPNNYHFERSNSLLSPNININNDNNSNIFNKIFNFKNIFPNEENNTIQNDNYEIINNKDKNEEKNDEN